MAYESVTTTAATIAVDHVGGKDFQAIKVDLGADGAESGPLCDANPLPSKPMATTAGGCSTHHRVATGDVNAAVVKAGPGQVYGIDVFNKAAYPIYLKFHNQATAPTAGTGVVRTVGVQAGVSRTIPLPLGSAFSVGIAITIVKNLADNDATVIVAGDCTVDIDFK